MQAAAEVRVSLAPNAQRFDGAVTTITAATAATTTDPAFTVARGGVVTWANATVVQLLQEGAELGLKANALEALRQDRAEPMRAAILRALQGHSSTISLFRVARQHLSLHMTLIQVAEQILAFVRVRDAFAARTPTRKP